MENINKRVKITRMYLPGSRYGGEPSPSRKRGIMKPSRYIIALWLTIAILLSYSIYRTDIRIKSIETGLNDTQTKISVLERVEIPQTEIEPILDEMKALVRENERLVMENADLKNQIREFGWLKEANQ